jgi:broad specificity phosphatase PhoE
VSSPRRRALKTAIPIARRHHVVIAIDDRLDDVDYGAWTGLSPAEIRREWPYDFDAYRRDPASAAFPGGESLLAAQSRACDVLADMAVHRLGPAAIVTHDVIARLLLGRVSGHSLAIAHATSVGRAVTPLDVRGRAITFAGAPPW